MAERIDTTLSRRRLLPGLLSSCLDLLLPSSCALCGCRAPRSLCDGCRTQFFRPVAARCLQCALPLPGASQESAVRCGACLAQPPAFDHSVAAADYAIPLDQLVLQLKFGNRLALAPLMGAMLREAADAAALPAPMTLMTAVPLGPQRLAERGFNQALEIARPLARSLGVPLLPRLIERSRDTRPQSLLAPEARRGNVRQAFLISPAHADAVRGQHVGVVDDVMTTGDTLNEIALLLKRYGAARVTCLVFARTPK
ncbi:comF family protein [Noviherbaspirillum humi]|uniref:ComF family protein n=1 Tax=Noviherbaspirillum humi TaxID=1688639 RepID=A0A239CID3_9BURK|nr:ComF family protein [Noviherbaspirillum humi]SNS19672.1 comF family protein [Noviherbaspirillum humi]